MNALSVYTLPVLLLMLVAAGLLGLGLGTTDYRLMLAGVLLPAGIMVVVRTELAVTALLGASFLVAGLVQLYLPQYQQISWLIAGMGGVVAGMVWLQGMLAQTNSQSSPSDLEWLMWAFAGYCLIISIANGLNLFELGYGAKGYFQMWGLFFAMAWLSPVSGFGSGFMRRLPQTLMGLAFLQLPFALQQYLFFVPLRAQLGGQVVAEDVVVGTFGASLEGGGANSILSMFTVMAAAMLLVLFLRGRLALIWLLLGSALLLAPAFVNASVITVFYLAVALGLLIFMSGRGSAGRNLLAGVLVCFLIGGVIWGNAQYASRAASYDGVGEFVVGAIERNIDEEHGYGEYVLNRMTVLPFWWQEQGKLENLRMWTGFGVGQAREAENSALVSKTLANTRYAGQGIGFTSMAGLLWETGVLGTLLILLIFVRAFFLSNRIVGYFNSSSVGEEQQASIFNPQQASIFDPQQASIFDPQQAAWQLALAQAVRIGLVLAVLNLLHKNLLLFHLPYQALCMVLLGYVAYWTRQIQQQRASAH